MARLPATNSFHPETPDVKLLVANIFHSFRADQAAFAD
jgi:hypothetical protein